MKIWRDKDGKWIDRKEFVERFKQGVEKVTPLQQTKSQIGFTILTIIGILCGIVVSIYKWESLWWLGIILIAGLGNTIVSYIGLYQKFLQLKKVEDMILQMKEVQDEQESTV